MKKCTWLIASFFLLAACSEPQPHKPPLRPLRVLEVEKEPTLGMHLFPGRTRAVGRASLSFRVPGLLIERPVKVGDHIPAGGLIARLDPRDYKAELEQARGALEQAQAQLRFAISDYERVYSIWQKDPGAISKSYLESKEEESNRLKGQVRMLQAQVDAAHYAYDYTFLRAPFSGTVVATYVNNHELVNAKQAVVRILNNSQVEMVIDIPETMISYLPFVKTFIVRIDSIPGETFVASVKEIGTEATRATRTYPVTLLMDQPDELKILAGMAGSARVGEMSIDEEATRAIIVPPSALFNEGSQSFVWIVDPALKQVQRRSVKTDGITNQGVKIAQGLTPGEWIAASGAHSLEEGQQVTILPMMLNAMGEQEEGFLNPSPLSGGEASGQNG